MRHYRMHKRRNPSPGSFPYYHPEFFEIIKEAKNRPIKHLMVNTNGVRIAQDEEFVKQLAEIGRGFEIYLQWDSFEKDALMALRGADLRKIRLKAMEQLNKYNISTTLVVTVAKGINDQEIGKIIEYATKQPCVRGVTLQPMQFAGRTDKFLASEHRLTLTEVRQSILDQTTLFEPSDIIPVPCNPDALSMGYALKLADTVIPLTRFIGPELLVTGTRNTIVFESDPVLKQEVFKLFATNQSPEGQANCLSSLMCCLPMVQTPPSISYNNVFRVLIMAFMDAVNFDTRAMKKSCVHIVQEDGRIIPFESYNLLYRDDKKMILDKLRKEVRAPFDGNKKIIPIKS